MQYQRNCTEGSETANDIAEHGCRWKLIAKSTGKEVGQLLMGFAISIQANHEINITSNGAIIGDDGAVNDKVDDWNKNGGGEIDVYGAEGEFVEQQLNELRGDI